MIRSLSQILGKRNLSVPDMRVDLVDETVLEAVSRLYHRLGILRPGERERQDPQAMRKGVTVEDNLRQWSCQEPGGQSGRQLHCRLSRETREDFEETMSFVEESDADDGFVSIAEPHPRNPTVCAGPGYAKDMLALYQSIRRVTGPPALRGGCALL